MVNIQNLVNVDGYAAGRNGNLLVARDENLKQSTVWQTLKTTEQVDMTICAVCVTDPTTQDWMDQYVDDFTDVNYMIVVGPDFFKRSKWDKQVILYNINQKVIRNNEIVERGEPIFIEEEVASNARIDTIAKFGKWRTNMAMKHMYKKQRKSEDKIGKKMHKRYKKEERLAKKSGGNFLQSMAAAPVTAMNKLAQGFKIDEPDDTSDEQAAANLEALENSMANEPTPAPQPAPAPIAPEPVPAS